MNTIIGNKVIAKFMGYKLQGNIVKSAPLDSDESDSYDNLIGYNISQAAYNKSWDWLMPVVKKIWTIINTYNYDSEKYFYMTEKIFHPDYSLNEFMNADIDSVYNRVIEFIKWYKNNEQYI